MVPDPHRVPPNGVCVLAAEIGSVHRAVANVFVEGEEESEFLLFSFLKSSRTAKGAVELACCLGLSTL